MQKNWQQLKLSVKHDEADQITEHLTAIGALATSTEETIAEVIVIALFAESFDRRIVNLLFDMDLRDNWELLTPESWQNQWKEDLIPINFTNRLSIIPRDNPNRVYLNLDSGQAFGSGNHPTTYLCLEWLDMHDLTVYSTAIDFGCGSGVLGIAAQLLGVQDVIAYDIDPIALENTQQNAKLNNIEINICEQLPEIQVDLMLANILAHTLVEVYSILTKHTKLGGTIILSGILHTQEYLIRKIFEPTFSLQIVQKEEWIMLYGSKTKES